MLKQNFKSNPLKNKLVFNHVTFLIPMYKQKKSKIAIIGVVLFSMMAMYGVVPMPMAQAIDSFSKVSDTLSDSDLSATAVTHTITFQPTTADLAADEYITVTFPGTYPTGFSGLTQLGVTCPNGGTASTTGNILQCTGSVLASTTIWTIGVTGMVNPDNSASFIITLDSYGSDNTTAIDTGQAVVYIINDVLMTAHVDASLTFTVEGVDAEISAANGIYTNGTSTDQTIPFGNLPTSGSTTIAQKLTVATNASAGYTVTVSQSDDLKSAGSADIDPFADGQANPATWASPVPVLGTDATYGHMGFTSSDTSDMTKDFTGGLFAGFTGTTAYEIMTHTGPTLETSGNGTGEAYVAYRIEISALQEAGDYSNRLTYVATPTF